jgi:hypothetical protein
MFIGGHGLNDLMVENLVYIVVVLEDELIFLVLAVDHHDLSCGGTGGWTGWIGGLTRMTNDGMLVMFSYLTIGMASKTCLWMPPPLKCTTEAALPFICVCAMCRVAYVGLEVVVAIGAN